MPNCGQQRTATSLNVEIQCFSIVEIKLVPVTLNGSDE